MTENKRKVAYPISIDLRSSSKNLPTKNYKHVKWKEMTVLPVISVNSPWFHFGLVFQYAED
jgi:CMP-N-acetylneuraminic acid synthetase